MSNSSDVYVIELQKRYSIKENLLPPEFCALYYDAEQSSFEEVNSTVPNKDDPSMNCLTWRSLSLGIIYVFGISYLHQWTYTAVYRFSIGSILVIGTAHLINRFLKLIKITPLTIKEETVILLMSNVCICFNHQYQYSTHGLLLQMNESRFTYARMLFFVVALQFAGYGYAGVLRRYLVWPSGQIWPSNMPYIALLRTQHENQDTIDKLLYDTKKKPIFKKLIDNRKYFFLFVSFIEFISSWFTKYLMRVLTSFSWMCMISSNNLLLSQFTGYRGLGFGSFTLDWQSLSDFLGSPLVVPKWALINIAIGFIITTWILTPIIYFSNVWNCREQSIAYFPYAGIFSNETYEWSALSIVTAATGFATPIAVIVHMILHDGKQLINFTLTKTNSFKGNDLHCRLIEVYKGVPDWWYGIISLLSIIVLIIISEVSNILQWYYVLLALVIPLIFSLPMGSVLSITGQIIQNASVYYICLVIGYAIFGDEKLSNNRTLFIAIGYTTFCQSLYIVSDMKLAHYMKIPPRILISVQSLSCLLCSIFTVVIEKHYEGNFNLNSTLRIGEYVTLSDYSAVTAFVSKDFFSSNSQYQVFLWIMIGGGFLPVIFWILSYRWSWCKRVHIPLILIVVTWMPTLPAGTLVTWISIGLLTVTVFYKDCWKRHIYLFSAGLSLGLNVMLLICGSSLWNRHIAFPVWWGTGGTNLDGCPLALNRTVGDWFFLSLHNTPD